MSTSKTKKSKKRAKKSKTRERTTPRAEPADSLPEWFQQVLTPPEIGSNELLWGVPIHDEIFSALKEKAAGFKTSSSFADCVESLYSDFLRNSQTLGETLGALESVAFGYGLCHHSSAIPSITFHECFNGMTRCFFENTQSEDNKEFLLANPVAHQLWLQNSPCCWESPYRISRIPMSCLAMHGKA